MSQRIGKLRQKAAHLAPRQFIVDSFHHLYYDAADTWQKNTFLGHTILQLPSDMWLYQEIVYREKPQFILQTGVKEGGSVVYFAHLLDIVGAPASAKVVGVDILLTEAAKSIKHPRVHLIEGSSVDTKTIDEVKKHCSEGSGLVSLDSDHTRNHVLKELELYWPFVAVDGHLVVEDTNINGHPVAPEFGPGPFEAVEAFLKTGAAFVSDDALWRRQMFTQHTWLRRTR
ncbi:MAG: CmcI family methyltransferase [Polyangiales bacterium]